ncbi:hypothetical protein HQ447_11345 [bacterium]|nr:hypothetical protein [bacterium]
MVHHPGQSPHPEFLNKTGDAITGYEHTLALQETATGPREEFANSNLEMARLQVKAGDPVSALATLERGAVPVASLVT